MSIDAMKQALAALNDYEPNEAHKVATALRAAIEQAQEPVAWMTFNAVGDEDDIWYVNPDGKLLEGWTYKPLYTAPRQWQGLTDEEVSKLIDNEIGFNSCWGPEEQFARAIEAKLKEKNTGLKRNLKNRQKLSQSRK